MVFKITQHFLPPPFSAIPLKRTFVFPSAKRRTPNPKEMALNVELNQIEIRECTK